MPEFIAVSPRLYSVRNMQYQNAQALILVLVMMIFTALGMFLLFNMGQLLREKTKLSNAADAVAYSGAVVQARAFNFHAFVNRAYLANEVAMAQLISFASWVNYADTMGQHALRRNPPPGVITYGFPLHGLGYPLAQPFIGQSNLWVGGNASIGILQQAFNAHDQIVHEVLNQAQRQVFENLPHMRLAAMQEVLKENYLNQGQVNLDQELLTDTLSYQDDKAPLLTHFFGQNRKVLGSLVEQIVSENSFLNTRSGRAISLTLVPDKRCLAQGKFYELRRQGGTRLLGLDTWQSLDTQAFHAPRPRRWIGCHLQEYPMGYSNLLGNPSDTKTEELDAEELVTSNTLPTDALPTDGVALDSLKTPNADNPVEQAASDNNPNTTKRALDKTIRWSFKGIPSFVDLSQYAQGLSDPKARLALRLTRPQSALRISGNDGVATSTGKLGIFQPKLAQKNMAAMAAAESYFERPVPRARGNVLELPSLFNPYWQVRLVATSSDERDRANQRQGFQP